MYNWPSSDYLRNHAEMMAMNFHLLHILSSHFHHLVMLTPLAWFSSNIHICIEEWIYLKKANYRNYTNAIMCRRSCKLVIRSPSRWLRMLSVYAYENSELSITSWTKRPSRRTVYHEAKNGLRKVKGNIH